MTYSQPPIIGVGVVVRDADGRILLGRREKAGESPSWCLPGGAVEPGEDFEAAAVRELREETGIDDAGEPRVTGIVVDHPDGRVRVTAAVTVTLGATPPAVTEPRVFRAWEWFDPGALPDPLFPATANILRGDGSSYRVTRP